MIHCLRLHNQSLPIADAAVLIKDTLRKFLFERVFFDFFFIDFNSQSRPLVGCYGPVRRIDDEAFVNNVVSPRNIIVD